MLPIMHLTSQLQVLVALAGDLQLDNYPPCIDAHRWLWFRRYCLASRVAKALEKRDQLPTNFCEEVMKKIADISISEEEMSRDHESHALFRREQDEQILLWMNRFVSCLSGYDWLSFREYHLVL